jgi:hypothetical protein
LLVLPGGLFDDHLMVIFIKWLPLLNVTERCERVGITPKRELPLLLLFLKLGVKVKEIV